MTDERIAVLGAGSWGTALVKLLSTDRSDIAWWVRDPAIMEHVRKHRHNPNYISSAELEPSRIHMDQDLEVVVRSADILVVAIPSAYVQATLGQLPGDVLKGRTVFSAVKGIVPETNQIVGEYLFTRFGLAERDFGVICGPCHAEEVAMEKLSYLTIACQDQTKAEIMGTALSGRFMRTTLSDDIYGTEYASILKNVIAVAAGITFGLGYGDNFRAVLVSRAIQEIERFVDAVHPITRDINEPAYLGDLLVTAYSTFSRNREFGNMVGKGYSVRAAQLEMNMVAEGYHAVKCVHAINEKFGVDMPICEATYRILYKQMSPALEMRLLSEKLA
ncbi:MAG: NAD(P)H-dependent glycerol-3-phosphate dehydrogenase [Flavobacteriales bacterium]|nr:NAD(P)H-dependent glycerol-3-phosphate dehydrogenase [Flavobacteriales bacterium]